jgi:tRNA U34 5-carboxymethylaminomethyl modifying GTPase MnmE/TrmE
MNRSDPKDGLSRRLPQHLSLNDDTICAVATPIGEGGIGLIRVSGGNAIQVVSQIFEAKGPYPLSKVKTHTIHYGRVVTLQPGKESTKSW